MKKKSVESLVRRCMAIMDSMDCMIYQNISDIIFNILYMKCSYPSVLSAVYTGCNNLSSFHSTSSSEIEAFDQKRCITNALLSCFCAFRFCFWLGQSSLIRMHWMCVSFMANLEIIYGVITPLGDKYIDEQSRIAVRAPCEIQLDSICCRHGEELSKPVQ